MRLNELSAQPYQGSFEEFYKNSLEVHTTEKLNKNGHIRPKNTAQFKELNGFRVLDSAIIHVNAGHRLSTGEWQLVLSLVKNEQNIKRQDEGKKAKFSGNPVIYELENDGHLYGLLIEWFEKAKPIVITAFEGTQAGIDDWFAKNQRYKKRVRQDEAHSLRYRIGMLPERDPNNSITENNKKVKTNEDFNSWFGNSKVVKDGKPLVVYHGSPEKFEEFKPELMNYGSISKGFCFFTNKKSAYPNCAKDYAGKDGYIYECYLRIEKPLHIKYGNTPDEYYHTPVHYWDTCQSDIRRDFRKGDYDGIIIENLDKSQDDSVIYLVPNANQIKSVDAKEFSNSANIYEQKAYHGTHAEFDKFDLDKIKDWRYGYGIYFTRSKGYASNYGEVGEYEVPDNEYLLSWEDSYEYQSEYVQDALYKLWKDAKEQGKHQEIERAIFGDFANDGEAIYYAVSEGLKLSGKATSELLYKYGIKGIDSFKGDCIVIFHPDDIKNAFVKLNKQIESLLEYVTPIYQDCLNQKELINEICKKKYEYRIIYDSNKDWYIIGTAYDKCHEQLLYNAASYYGFTFDEMTEYYNEHYMNLHDLLYTPKEIGLQLGFDHNDKVYTFKGFGSIYTKGEDLPKVLLDDLTSRFGKPIFKEKIKENLTKLEFKKDIIVADNLESLEYFLKTTKKDCRIVIDKFAGLSIISDVTEVHYNAFLYAVNEGWYGEHIEDNDEEYWEYHLESEDLTLLIFSKDSSEEYLGQDGFRYVFEYPYGYIYARIQSLPDELLNVIGQPVSTTESEDLDAGYTWEDWSIENVLKRIPKRETELRDKISKMDIEDLKPYFRQVFHLYYMPNIENLKIKLGMNIYESLSRIIERYL